MISSLSNQERSSEHKRTVYGLSQAVELLAPTTGKKVGAIIQASIAVGKLMESLLV